MTGLFSLPGLPANAVPIFILLEDFHVVQPVSDPSVYGLLDQHGSARYVGAIYDDQAKAVAEDRHRNPFQLSSQQYWARWRKVTSALEDGSGWRKVNVDAVPPRIVADLRAVFRTWAAEWELERLARKKVEEEARERREQEEEETRRRQIEESETEEVEEVINGKKVRFRRFKKKGRR